MDQVPEVRREKVFIPAKMSIEETQDKYGLTSERARAARQKGFFVKNYMTRQIIIAPEIFDPDISCLTAKKVFGKNFSRNPLALSLRDDLLQEAVVRMYELSGKVKEGATKKYGIGYQFFWVAHNAMLSFLKTWDRQSKWCESLESLSQSHSERRKTIPFSRFGWSVG